MKRIFLNNNWAKVAALCACAAVASVVSCSKPEDGTGPGTAKDFVLKAGAKVKLDKTTAELLGKKEGDEFEFTDAVIKMLQGGGEVKLKVVSYEDGAEKELKADEVVALYKKVCGDYKTLTDNVETKSLEALKALAGNGASWSGALAGVITSGTVTAVDLKAIAGASAIPSTTAAAIVGACDPGITAIDTPAIVFGANTSGANKIFVLLAKGIATPLNTLFLDKTKKDNLAKVK